MMWAIIGTLVAFAAIMAFSMMIVAKRADENWAKALEEEAKEDGIED